MDEYTEKDLIKGWTKSKTKFEMVEMDMGVFKSYANLFWDHQI